MNEPTIAERIAALKYAREYWAATSPVMPAKHVAALDAALATLEESERVRQERDELRAYAYATERELVSASVELAKAKAEIERLRRS
jgi:hypothetical protein